MSLVNFDGKDKSSKVYLPDWVYLAQCGEYYGLGVIKSAREEDVLSLQIEGYVKPKLIGYFLTVNGDRNEKEFTRKFWLYKVSPGIFAIPKEEIEQKEVWFRSYAEADTADPVFPKETIVQAKFLYSPTAFHPCRNKRNPGHVYLIKCVFSKKYPFLKGIHKIGFTTQNIERRKKAIEIEIEGKTELVNYFWTEDPAREEIEIHYAMQKFRSWREWFDIPDSMLNKEKIHIWFSSDERGFLDVNSINTNDLPSYT